MLYWAGSGLGKSQILCYLAASAILQGKNVVYYTLELAESEISLRIDSKISGIPLDALTAKKDIVLEKLKENVKGNLIVKFYPTKSITTNALQSHLSRLIETGHNIDLVCLDYADLLKSISTRKEKREELESIYEELRRMSR